MPWLNWPNRGCLPDLLATWITAPKSRIYITIMARRWISSFSVCWFAIALVKPCCIIVHLVELTCSQFQHFLHIFFSTKDFFLAPFHTAFNSLFPQNYVSLYPSPSSHTHIVYLNLKDSPSVMQAVSPPSHSISLPFSSLLCTPLPRMFG